MDGQVLFNIIIAIAGFSGGFILNRIFKAIDRLDKDVRNMPLQYVTKSDFHRDIDEIKMMLREIYEKLHDKADRE